MAGITKSKLEQYIPGKNIIKKIVFIMCFFSGFSLYAQRTITGNITSSEDGLGIIGGTVMEKGTTNGTVTDWEGNYTITVADGATLVFSYVGMKTKEVVLGATDVINVVLDMDIEELEEIVVTAVGIERESKTIGYSITTIKSDELTKAKETNIVNSLSAKVSGVRVTNSSGTVGSSSKITIRGVNSLNGGSPLFVIDGVPIFNTNYNGSDNNRQSSADVGNRAGDINPEDIESITVLKGASAAALYGSQAKDGVIMITTKKGTEGSTTSVETSSSFRWDAPLVLPNMQYTFAQGTNGKYNVGAFNGWGPNIKDESANMFSAWGSGEDAYLQAYPDNVNNFYETGFLSNNSVAISGNNGESNFRLSVANTSQSGIVPAEQLNRNNLSFSGGMKMPNKFRGSFSGSYIKTETKGRMAQGGNNQNVLGSMLYSLPNTINVADLRDYKNPDGTQRELGDVFNNPYWVAYENGLSIDVERFFGSFELGYDPFPWLSFTNRLGTDFYTEYRRLLSVKGTKGAAEGALTDTEIFNKLINNDFLMTLKKDVSDFEFTGVFGHNFNQRYSRLIDVNAKEFEIANFYNYSNAYSVTSVNGYSMRRLMGIFGDVNVNYKGYLNLNFTGRNDWSSTLPKENNSYFYPSASLSFLLTDAVPNLKNQWLSYAKLRANIAQVGSDEDPYQLMFSYNPASTVFVQYQAEGNQNSFPHGGHLAYTADHVLPPLSLVPERQTSYEIGADLYFLESKLQLDVSYYSYVTKNQIIKAPVAYSTGFSFKSVNAGVVSNNGIEILATVSAVSTKNFSWKARLNFGANRQEIKSLADGIDKYTLIAGFNGMEISAEEGESLGLYGRTWLRDEEGNLVIGSDGLRIPGEIERLGNISPDWTMGINNSFTFLKNFSLSFLIDMRQGGVIYSGTAQVIRAAGMAEETTINRDEYKTFIEKGVNGYVTDDGELVITSDENTIPVESMQQFWQNYSNGTVAESNVYDASYVKLREVRLGYTIPSKIISNTFIKNAEIGLEGRNLWLIKSSVPHIDPEANIFGSGSIGEGIEWLNLPSVRSFGFNVRLTF